MQTISIEEEKEDIKDLSLALMAHIPNQPTCKNCGNKFKPRKDQLEVALPDTGKAEYRASRTSHVEEPDYCSKECRGADKI